MMGPMNGKMPCMNGMMGRMMGANGTASAPNKLLSALSVEERVHFAAEVLPGYGRALFRGLAPEDKVKLAQAVIAQMEATFDVLVAEEDDGCFMGKS